MQKFTASGQNGAVLLFRDYCLTQKGEIFSVEYPQISLRRCSFPAPRFSQSSTARTAQIILYNCDQAVATCLALWAPLSEVLPARARGLLARWEPEPERLAQARLEQALAQAPRLERGLAQAPRGA